VSGTVNVYPLELGLDNNNYGNIDVDLGNYITMENSYNYLEFYLKKDGGSKINGINVNLKNLPNGLHFFSIYLSLTLKNSANIKDDAKLVFKVNNNTIYCLDDFELPNNSGEVRYSLGILKDGNSFCLF
jgi:hypothetical protein